MSPLGPASPIDPVGPSGPVSPCTPLGPVILFKNIGVVADRGYADIENGRQLGF